MPENPRVHRLFGWRSLVLLPLAALIRLWSGTLRIDISPESRRIFESTGRPAAFVLWHNRLFIAPESYRRYRRSHTVHGLVSASRDGAWLAALFQLVGIRPIRGSSSRYGREAAAELMEALRNGHDVGITPDGPRGPRYDFKPGALVVAQRADARMILVGAEFAHAWRLRSWDGFYVPWPFSRVVMRIEELAPESVDAAPAGLRAINPDHTAKR